MFPRSHEYPVVMRIETNGFLVISDMFSSRSSVSWLLGGAGCSIPVTFLMISVALPRGVDETIRIVVFVLLNTISVCLVRFTFLEISGIVVVDAEVVLDVEDVVVITCLIVVVGAVVVEDVGSVDVVVEVVVDVVLDEVESPGG